MERTIAGHAAAEACGNGQEIRAHQNGYLPRAFRYVAQCYTSDSLLRPPD